MLASPINNRVRQRMNEKFLTRAEAAAYVTASGLPLAKSTLQKMVTCGGGPTFRKFGNRAVYTTSDLDSWAAAKLSAPRRTSAAA